MSTISDRAPFAANVAAFALFIGWRAHTEEVQLSRIFGERFVAYRERTRMIIPYLL